VAAANFGNGIMGHLELRGTYGAKLLHVLLIIRARTYRGMWANVASSKVKPLQLDMIQYQYI